MKRHFLYIVLCLFFASVGYSQSDSKPSIVFKHYEHNFSKLKYNENAVYEFVFKNLSDSVQIITNVKAKCGCTTTAWTQEPLKKNGKGHIQIKYDTKIVGRFTKSIYVFFQGENQPIKLTISGVVDPPMIGDVDYENYMKKHKHRNNK